jgi:hypothetical protein
MLYFALLFLHIHLFMVVSEMLDVNLTNVGYSYAVQTVVDGLAYDTIVSMLL